MRKNNFFIFMAFASFILCQWIVSPGFAQGSKIGVVGAVHGTAKAVAADGSARPLNSGDPVFLDDQLNTASDGHLQILLMDETVFTLGPLSSLAASEFAYDPSTSDGKVRVKVIEGIFRVVSGKIAHKKPENMNVDLPAGSIGFRGTLIAGKSEGMRSLVVLLGPVGMEGVSPGRIVVSNTVKGETVSVDISEKGYGTVIEGTDLAPLPAFKIPEDEIASLAAALNDISSGGNSGVSGYPGNSSGAGFDPGDMAGVFSGISQMDEYVQKVAQGGTLTPPQAVMTPVVVGGGRDGGDDNNNSQNGNS